MRFSRHGQRGQTLPLWIIATLMGMTMCLFVFNYSNTIRYSIRAQNAADSAAAAAIGNDAAALNATNTLLSAFDIQELRVRDIEAAVPNLLTGSDPNCAGATALLTQACTTDLVNATSNLTTQLQNLNKVATTLNTFSGQLTDRVANPTSLVTSLFAPNGANGCAVAALTDCDFKYTTYIKYGTNGLPTVDEYTCKKVPNLGAGFLHLGASNQTFYAIGHTRQTLSPVGLSYSTSSLGGMLASTSSLFPTLTSTNLVGSLAGLDAQSYYYVPQTVAPDPNATPAALSTVCP